MPLHLPILIVYLYNVPKCTTSGVSLAKKICQGGGKLCGSLLYLTTFVDHRIVPITVRSNLVLHHVGIQYVPFRSPLSELDYDSKHWWGEEGFYRVSLFCSMGNWMFFSVMYETVI